MSDDAEKLPDSGTVEKEGGKKYEKLNAVGSIQAREEMGSL